MNKIEKQEEAEAIYVSYGWTCQNLECGKSVFWQGTPQLAHQIADTKPNRSKYGSAVIDHPKNRKPTCSLYCNGKMNIAGNPGRCKELVNEIEGLDE